MISFPDLVRINETLYTVIICSSGKFSAKALIYFKARYSLVCEIIII